MKEEHRNAIPRQGEKTGLPEGYGSVCGYPEELPSYNCQYLSHENNKNIRALKCCAGSLWKQFVTSKQNIKTSKCEGKNQLWKQFIKA